MTNPTGARELLDKPGSYYEEEPLNTTAALLAGRIAIKSERVGGQWAVDVYSGKHITSSQIQNDEPLLGSIITDMAGMSEDPRNDGGPRLARDEVLPIVISWLGDRGLRAVTGQETPLASGMHENEAYMGTVFEVIGAE